MVEEYLEMPDGRARPGACETFVRRDTKSSRHIGWTSMLVERRVIPAGRATFDTPSIPDTQLVLRLTPGSLTEMWEDGRWRGSTYPAGSLGLLRGGEVRRARYVADRADQVGVVLVPDRVLGEGAELLRRAGQPAPIVRPQITCFQHPGVAATCRALLSGVARGFPDLYAEQGAHWLAMQLLTTTAVRTLDVDRRSAGRLTDVRLTRVVDFVRGAISQPLSLERLAAEAGLSKFHFTRLFRERTGLTPMMFVERERMDAAARLLRGTDLSIEDIARKIGYAGGDQFRVAFKRCFRDPPSRYRRRG